MLALEIFPLGEVALVLAPASGKVAVVDARARAIVDALREGCRDGDRAQATALRRAWATLARPDQRRDTAQGLACDRSPPALDVLCRAGVASVRLRVWPRRLARLLHAVTLPCHDASPTNDSGGRTTEVRRVGGRYVLHEDGDHGLTTANLMLARSEALRRLVIASHPDRNWLAVLHGAGVADENGAALLCGPSGAGKSTLTGLLVASGLELVTDDYAPIEAGTRLLWPVPFGLSVKEGSWPVLAPHFPDIANTPTVHTRTRRQRYLATVNRATRPQPLRCLIFPLYLPGAPLELTKLQPGEALELCTRSGGWYESSRDRLAELVDWIGEIPAYALSYGDGPSAVATVRRLIAR